MIKLSKYILAVVMISLALSTAHAGSMTAPAGYKCVDTVFAMPTGAYFGGFDILPNGNFAVLDGLSLREININGDTVRTLYTYSQFVYGSFARYNAVNNSVYIGESSSGTIKSVSLQTGAVTDIAVLPMNYDLDFWGGKTYVTAGNTVYLVDEATGVTDDIASAGVVSGPLAFSASGDLIYGTGEYSWPPKSNNQNIFKWNASDAASAIGDGVLTESDAQVIGANVDGPSGLAIDGLGRLLYSDTIASPGALRMIDNGVDSVLSTSLLSGADPTIIRCNAAIGNISIAVTWFDSSWNRQAVISTFSQVPEPSSIAALVSLIGLAGTVKLLRRK